MRQISRTHFAIGLLAAVVAVAGAAVQPDAGLEARQSLVRGLLEKPGQTLDSSVLDAAARACLLSAVALDDPSGKSITLRTEGKPYFDYALLEDGKKVVLDLFDTLNALPEAKLTAENNGPVREIRTVFQSFEPRFVTRVTISLSRICELRFHQEEGSVRIDFSSPQEVLTSAGLARKVEAQLEDRLRRVDIKRSAIQECIARWESHRGALDAELDADFAVVSQAISKAKHSALAHRLREAIPSDTDMTLAAQDGTSGSLGETDRAVATQKAELKARLSSLEERIATAAADSVIRARQTTDRVAYDLSASRALAERLSTKEGAKDAQSIEGIHVLELKLERLQAEDLNSLDDCKARCETAMVEYRAALAEAAEQLGQARTALAGISQEGTGSSDAAKLNAADGTDVAIAALGREVSRLQDAGAPAPTKAVTNAAPKISAVISKPQTNVRVAALQSQLEAVKETQLSLALAPIKPLAALADDPVLLAQANDEPVATEGQTASLDPKAEQAAVPEETATAPAPPQPELPPAPAAPPAPEPQPAAPPVKSEVIVTPTPESSGGATGDITALNEPVNLDLREMELSNFVALLAKKAGINVIAGTELSGTVTASIRNVRLIDAMEMVLRMHDLGVVEEEGVFRIIPYEDAQVAERVTEMITLKSANVDDVKLTLDNILMNTPDGKLVSVAPNPSTNVLIISGPQKRVDELRSTVEALDVAKPVTPTITEAIKLNYALPDEVMTMVQGMLTKDKGKAAVDVRGRHIVVTDVPAVIESVRNLVSNIDMPTKQVAIEAMIVDAVLNDSAETGVEWTLNAVQHLNTRGEVVGSLNQGSVGTVLGNVGTSALDAGLINFNVLTSDIDLKAAIAAEASSKNAKILANPQLVIIENETGNISIVDEYPYQEITQSTQGPPVSTTEFKPIGVTLEVMPRVTHSNEIIAEIQAKQSSITGLTDSGVPIEAKREAQTTLSVKDGQTIFIGGLRRFDDRLEVSKVPVLGDVPVLNFLFRNTKGEKVNTELMVFMTCRVVGEHLPELTPKQQEKFDELENTPEVPNAPAEVLHSFVKPGEMRDPALKWRRSTK